MRMVRQSLAITLIGAALAAAGCGLQPGGLGTSTHSLFHAKGDAQADAVAAAVAQGWQSLNTASGIVSFWETDGKDISTSTAEFYWSRPEKLRANVTDASSSSKKGVKLVYLGDGKITAKLGFFKKTFPYDDPQVLSLRGYRIDQTSLSAMIGAIIDPSATLKYVGATTVNGQPADIVECAGSPKFLPGLPKIDITIDRQTHAPCHVEGFAATGVVYKASVSNIKINPQLPSDIFVL